MLLRSTCSSSAHGKYLGKERDHKSNFLWVVPHFRRDKSQDDEVFEGGGVVLGNEMDDVLQQGVALLLGYLQTNKKTHHGEEGGSRVYSALDSELDRGKPRSKVYILSLFASTPHRRHWHFRPGS